MFVSVGLSAGLASVFALSSVFVTGTVGASVVVVSRCVVDVTGAAGKAIVPVPVAVELAFALPFVPGLVFAVGVTGVAGVAAFAALV